jgi:hypothetical protein
MTDMYCEGCGQHFFLIPLHGGKGGTLRRPPCVGGWNAEHGRRRRTGRLVIRSANAFLDAAVTYSEIDQLTLSAGDLLPSLHLNPLGYMVDSALRDGRDVDLTSELLGDLLKLTRPDHQPPKCKEMAHRVTQPANVTPLKGRKGRQR